MSSAWIFQKPEHVRDQGEDKAPWYVGWYEPSGRRRHKCCGAGLHGKKAAERRRHKLENELMTGTYQMETRKLWKEFRKEYDKRILAGRAGPTREQAKFALDHFERIIKPIRVLAINTQHVDDFIAARRQEPGIRKGETVSPATINKELRHLKAALRKPKRWGYLHAVPEVDMVGEPGKLPTYIPPDHFAKLYQACAEHARWPEDQPYPAADWWQALLITGHMTGWRIGQLLALKRSDVNLDAGTVVTRWETNKGKRDQIVPLHPFVVEHLKKLAGFSPYLFPWNHGRRRIYAELNRIQDAAGVRPTGKAHYGFHDVRRAFATMNADRMTPDALQALMQHKDYQTTQRYINMARQLTPAVQNLYVPDLGRKAGGS